MICFCSATINFAARNVSSALKSLNQIFCGGRVAGVLSEKDKRRAARSGGVRNRTTRIAKRIRGMQKIVGWLLKTVPEKPGACKSRGCGSAFEMSRLLKCLYFLNVQVLHIEGIVLDELAASLDVFTHESSEDGFTLGEIFEFHG